MSFSRRGHPLAEEEKSTDAAKARARAMELLAGQELSSGQLYERLGRKFTQPTAAAAVAEMVERQYVDDARYARTRAHGPAGRPQKPPRRCAGSAAEGGWTAAAGGSGWKEGLRPDEAGGGPELEPPPPSWKGGTAASWPQGGKTFLRIPAARWPQRGGGNNHFAVKAAAALVEGRYRGKLAAGRKDLVVAALARRGFAYPIIKEAIKRVEEN